MSGKICYGPAVLWSRRAGLPAIFFGILGTKNLGANSNSSIITVWYVYEFDWLWSVRVTNRMAWNTTEWSLLFTKFPDSDRDDSECVDFQNEMMNTQRHGLAVILTYFCLASKQTVTSLTAIYMCIERHGFKQANF
jgi:hypothetical protein